MPLTEEEKRKIEEEERYRTQVSGASGSRKKGPGCFTILLIIFVGIPLLATFFILAVNPAKNSNDSKQTNLPTPTPTTTYPTEEACTLQVKASYTKSAFVITNNGNYDWNAVITIYTYSPSGENSYEAQALIPAGTEQSVLYTSFSKSPKGTEFNPYGENVKIIHVFDKNTSCAQEIRFDK